MDLRSAHGQTVSIPRAGCTISFLKEETIWTESSHKYDPKAVVQMGERSGYRCAGQWLDFEWPLAQNLFFAV